MNRKTNMVIYNPKARTATYTGSKHAAPFTVMLTDDDIQTMLQCLMRQKLREYALEHLAPKDSEALPLKGWPL